MILDITFYNSENEAQVLIDGVYKAQRLDPADLIGAKSRGDVVEISLGDGRNGYGVLLEHPLIAFKDICATEPQDAKSVAAKSTLFVLMVMDSALKSGNWSCIGRVPHDLVDKGPFRFFKQDSISKSFSVYEDDNEAQCEREDVEGLERAAVWSANHVEDRLRDHFDGVSNKWVQSLRPK